MLCLNWFVNITASKNQQNVRVVSCTKMSCKCFLFVLIITQVKVAHPSKDQNASIDGCVSFNWIGDFFARHKQSEWNDTVNEIIEDCLSNYSKVNETTGCNGPIVNVTFPLFSCSSNATLLEREFSSVLVIKEESFTTGRQIVHAFAQIWELLVLCIIAAMLSGIVIWFLVGIPKSFCILTKVDRLNYTNGKGWCWIDSTKIEYFFMGILRMIFFLFSDTDND